MKRPVCPYCCPNPRAGKCPELVLSGYPSPCNLTCRSCKDKDGNPRYFDSKGVRHWRPKGVEPRETTDPDCDRWNKSVTKLVNIVSFKRPKKPSLNYCLRELGALEHEVYRSNNGLKYSKKKDVCTVKYKSLLSEMSNGEILAWGEYLYYHKLKKFHPDLHKNKDLYTEYCQHLGEMIDRVRIIIRNRR